MNKGAQIAGEKGILIADTKFEFGLVDGKIILIDEVLTPDSSRFWPKSELRSGRVSEKFRQTISARLPAFAGLGQNAPRSQTTPEGNRQHACQVCGGADVAFRR